MTTTTRASTPRRSARAMPWSRSGLFHAEAPASPRTASPDPAWLLDLKDDVTRSVFAIEQVAGQVASMRDDSDFFRTVAAELRRELDTERKETGRRLVAQGRSMSKQQRRTAAAEACADSLAGMLSDLERQLSTCRAQTERLVDAVDHAVTVEADSRDLF